MAYVIIVGAGTYGERITRETAENGHNVVLVEKDEDTAKSMATDIDGVVIQGDATDAEILEEAGIEECDILLSTVSDSSVNVLVTLLAREYEIDKIVAVATSQRHTDILEKVGADAVERPKQLVSENLSHYVEEPLITNFLSLGDEKDVVKILVSEDSDIEGRQIGNLDSKLPEKSLIVAIQRDSSVVIPKGNSKIVEGDYVTIACNREDVSEIESLF